MKTTMKTVGKHTALAIAIAGALVNANVHAEEAAVDDNTEVIEITGLLNSLKRAMIDKQTAPVVSDGIAAEDLGKFPDLNVAESLQRITGVSIDRSGGEGQAVTVRGFGPQFNTVLVNGRQIATDSPGREFNFDIIAADQITGAEIFKTTTSKLQEGGIGGTINISTARPFDYQGFQLVGSAKAMYETLSEKTSPQVSGLISNTFNDNTLGVLLAVSHSERDVQINRIETAGWRPGITLSNRNSDVLTDINGVPASNVYFPRNWDQIVDNQERTRTNASLVTQYAPTDEITITLDGYVSKFEVDSTARDLASWFEPNRVSEAEIDPATGTVLFFNQQTGIHAGSGDPATDFVTHSRNARDSENKGFGLNVEWDINEQFNAVFDISTSDAENNQAGQQPFNVIGIINNYEFDSTGAIPTVRHDGFENGNLPNRSLARAHYNEISGFTDKDEITELKADFEYLSDSDTFTGMKFGIYRQEREKSRFQKFTTQGCSIYCGYNIDVPDELLTEFTANNYFSGLIDTFYTYDSDAYFAYLETDQALNDADAFLIANDDTGEIVAGEAKKRFTDDDGNFGHVPTLRNNRYTINEDITSLYVDLNFATDIGDMPLDINFGLRYSETSIDVAAVQSTLDDIIPTNDLTLFENVENKVPTNIIEGGSYTNLLPSLNAKLELQENVILRFAIYDSITRPTMSQLSPATVYNEPRRQNLTASGGNPTLEPFKSENWDVSLEWYYSDASLFSFAVFNKKVDDFIITLTGPETFTLADRAATNGFRCNESNSPLCAEGVILDDTQPGVDVVSTTEELNGVQEVITVSRPQNGEEANVNGYEIAWTHVWDNGFGITANATVVNSDVSLGSDTSQSFALEGLGDSQNIIAFYEADNWQARIAFNNREGFLRQLDNGTTGEPVNTETFGQWDISASYDVNENMSVFFEGINITEEELVQTGRFANQIYNIEDNGARYAVGIRAKF